jgi:hypothetical protein
MTVLPSSYILFQQSFSTEHTFLACRILFLCTATASSAASFIEWLVEHKRPNAPGSGTVVDVLGARMDDLSDQLRGGNRAAKEAMTDMLKLTFNLCVHYPKVGSRSLRRFIVSWYLSGL